MSEAHRHNRFEFLLQLNINNLRNTVRACVRLCAVLNHKTDTADRILNGNPDSDQDLPLYFRYYRSMNLVQNSKNRSKKLQVSDRNLQTAAVYLPWLSFVLLVGYLCAKFTLDDFLSPEQVRLCLAYIIRC